jgi:hypothetical protein
MVRASALALFAVTLTSLAGASQINVDVSEDVDIEHYNLEHSTTTSSVNSVNVTVENFGSSSCLHSLKAEIEAANTTYIRYSEPIELEAGDVEPQNMKILPMNHTGKTTAEIYSAGCDRTTSVGSITYNQTKAQTTNTSLEAKTTASTPSRLAFETEDLENATLVPRQKPAVWKIGDTQLVNGRAETRIEPTVYKKSYNITYTVVENGTATAQLKVGLRRDLTGLEQIRDKLESPLVAAVSMATNLVLVAILVARNRQNLKKALSTKS